MANKEKKKMLKQEKAKNKPFMSDRQKKVLLGVLVLLFITVPVVDVFRCKMACMKRVKTPYPEIACRYECPWPWQKAE